MSDENPKNLLEMEASVIRLGRQMFDEYGPRGVILFERAVARVREEPMALSLAPVGEIPPPLEEPPPLDPLANVLP